MSSLMHVMVDVESTGPTSDEVEAYPNAGTGMIDFQQWLRQQELRTGGKPVFWSDNNGFDWQFVNAYFWRFCSTNPFGHSSRNLADFYKGLKGDMRASFKHLRKTKHTHNALDDARGNAEAMLTIMANSGPIGWGK